MVLNRGSHVLVLKSFVDPTKTYPMLLVSGEGGIELKIIPCLCASNNKEQEKPSSRMEESIRYIIKVPWHKVFLKKKA